MASGMRGRRGRRSRRCAPATRRAAGLAGYRRRLERHVRARATTASCAGRPSWCCRDRVQHLYPRAGRQRRRADVPRRQPDAQAGAARASLARGAQARRRPLARPGPRRPRRRAGRSDERPADADRHDRAAIERGRPCSFEDRMDDGRVPTSHERAHIVVDGDVVRRAARTRECVVACPANLFVPDQRRRHPLQLRAVLRVRHLLHGLQHRGRHQLDLPRGRPRRRVPPHVIAACLSGSSSCVPRRRALRRRSRRADQAAAASWPCATASCRRAGHGGHRRRRRRRAGAARGAGLRRQPGGAHRRRRRPTAWTRRHRAGRRAWRRPLRVVRRHVSADRGIGQRPGVPRRASSTPARRSAASPSSWATGTSIDRHPPPRRRAPRGAQRRRAVRRVGGGRGRPPAPRRARCEPRRVGGARGGRCVVASVAAEHHQQPRCARTARVPAPWRRRRGDTLDRLRQLTDSGGVTAHGERVTLEPAAAAERIVSALRDWGYVI